MTEPASDSSKPSPRARVPRWLWLCAALLGLVVAIRATLPVALEWAIPWLAQREAGAEVEIGNVDLGLLTGRIVVEGLRVARPNGAEGPSTPAPEPPAETPPDSSEAEREEDGTPVDPAQVATVDAAAPDPGLLSLARLELEIDWLELIGRHVSLPVIKLDELTLRLRQKADGSFALPHAEASADDASEAEVESEEQTQQEGDGGEGGWQISLGRFELNQPDLAIHSDRLGRQVVGFTSNRFAIDALTSGPAGFGLGDISLDGPEVFTVRDWLLDPGFGGGEEEAPAEDDSGPPSLQISHLALSSGRFLIRSPDGPIESAIRVEVSKFDTAPGHTFPVEIVLDVGDGGATLKGQLGIFPPAYEGELTWHGLRVPPYLLLTTPEVVPWLASCDAEGRLDVSFRSQEPAELVVRGESHFSNLVFRHPETGELALEAERMSGRIREASYPLEPGQPRRVEIAALEITAPKLVFTNPPDALDELIAIFTEPPAAEEAVGDNSNNGEQAEAEDPEPPAPEPAQSAMTIDIDELTIANGELVFVDRSVTPRHETRVRDFRLDAADVKTEPGGAQKFSMAGLIQKRGTFDITGSLPGGKGSLRFVLRKLDLASYNGFARGAGWNLDKGQASLESSIRIRDDRYDSENDLVLHDLRLDSNDPDAFSSLFGVSLDFALALLRSPDGDIALELPVSVTRSDSGVGVGTGSLIRSALREALKGALTSPLKLLGGLLPSGSKPASLDAIAFEPGTVELNDDASGRIEPLVELTRNRPGLGITLRGQTAPADTPSLALAVLRERAAAGEGMPELDEAGFFARRRLTSALRERAEGGEGILEPADEALLARYVEAQEVPDERYEALGNARAKSLREALEALGADGAALTVGPAERADGPGVALGLGLRRRVEAEESS